MTFSVLAFCRCEQLFHPPAQPMPALHLVQVLQQIEVVVPTFHRAVVLSAYGDMKNIRVDMNRGVFDFLVKPVDFDDMRLTIERPLQNLEAWRDAVASRDELVSLNRDLEIAWRIQNSVLPRTFPTYAGYDLHGVLEPASTVSGDLYDVIRLDGDRVGLVVADVSGKGVPACRDATVRLVTEAVREFSSGHLPSDDFTCMVLSRRGE